MRQKIAIRIWLKALFTVFFVAQVAKVEGQLAAGTYTIGSTGNYQSINAAVAAMQSGITGQVTFLIAPGSYNEQITIDSIPGASANSKVIFTSQNADSSSVIIHYANTSTNNFVLKLNNSKFVAWQKLTLKSTGGANSVVVMLNNNSDYNSFENCVVISDTTATTTSSAGFYSNSTNSCDFNSFRNNRIIGGRSGIYWNGTTTSRIKGLIFNNNIITGYYYSGIYVPYTDSVEIIGNQVFNRVSATSVYGIYIFNYMGDGTIAKNYVLGTGTSSFYGFYIRKQSTAPGYLNIVNNVVVQKVGTGTAYGLYLTMASNINVHGNSVLINGGSATSGRALFVDNVASSGISLKNNSFVNRGPGYAYYLISMNSITNSDYNNFYATGTNFANINSAIISNLTTLQTYGIDGHSKNLDPNFTSSTDLHCSSVGLFRAGTPLPTMMDDFDGDTRDTVAPCIGADEFFLTNDDAGIIALVEPSAPCANMPAMVKVKVKNWGIDSLFSVVVNWKVDNMVMTPKSLTTALAPGADTLVELDTISFAINQVRDFKLWTSTPNLVADQNPNNDSLLIAKQPALQGNYSIGLGTGFSFNSFGDAIDALHDLGICGNVVFNVDTGTYNEIFIINAITGASPTSTITFKSASGDSSLVKIRHDAISASDNYVVQLDGANNIIFSNLSIILNSSFTNSKMVEFKNGAHDNIIKNCFLNNINPAISGAVNVYNRIGAEHNSLINNRMKGGYYSVDLEGSTTSGSYTRGIVVKNNIIEDFQYRGIDSEYQDSLLVEGNTVRSNLNSLIDGIYSSNIRRSKILANDIQLTNNGYGRGIYLNKFGGYMGDYGLVANNFVSKVGGSTNSSSGIYFYLCDSLNIVNNSIHMADNYLTSSGLYQNGGTGLKIFNNNVVVSGLGYAFYVSSLAAIDSCDFNNYYTNGSSLAFLITGQPNLADFKVASGKDNNSMSVFTAFASNIDLHTQSPYLNASAKPLSFIDTDIDGEVRSTTPDIGADEFVPPLNDAGLVQFKSPATTVGSGTSPVKVVLKNYGSNAISNATINWQVNGATQSALSWSGNLAPGQIDTNVILGNFNFAMGAYDLKAWSSLPNGVADGFAADDTIEQTVNVYIPPLHGLYHVGGSGADFANFNAAVTALELFGIDSNVIFMVNAGTYNEQISIDSIPGMTPTRRVYFIPASLDSTTVIITNHSSLSDNYVVRLNGVSNVEFNRITIRATNPSSGYAVVLKNGASRNTFYHNVIESPYGNYNLSIPIYISNITNENENRFEGNRVKNGLYGFYTYGANINSKEKGNAFVGNVITDFYSMGIYGNYVDSVIIACNTISSVSMSPLKGIYLQNIDNYLAIGCNRITLDGTAQTMGIQIYYYNGTDSVSNISNNFVSLNCHNNYDFGIYVGYAHNLWVLYNSVNIYGYGTNSKSFISYGTCSNLSLLNNNFVNNADGYSCYFYTGNPVNRMDFNNLYTSGSKIGYLNVDMNDLYMWQMYTTLDSHSVSVDPHFYSTTSYKISSMALNNSGTWVNLIQSDIDQEGRSTTNPDIGADEYQPLQVDAGLHQINSPLNKNGNSQTGIEIGVRIRNYGLSGIASAMVGYKVDGLVAVTYNVNLNLVSGGDTDLVIGSNVMMPVGQHVVKVFVIVPGDLNTSNDSLSFGFHSLPVVQAPFADGFDGTTLNWANSGQLWQHGTPQGTLLDSAFSAPSAWGTNLSGNYGPNSAQFLYSPFVSFTGVYNARLRFRHKHATGDNLDGLRVEASVNGGTIWSLLGYYGDPDAENWYNEVNNGVHYFTGNSGAWELSSCDLSFFNNNPVPVQFRFSFSSNSSNESEGWLIDDFEIYTTPLPIDLGVVGILGSDSLNYGSTNTVEVRFANFGSDTITQCPLVFRVGNAPPITEIWNGSIAPGDTINYVFGAGFVYQNEAIISSYTDNNMDMAKYNDTIIKQLHLVPSDYDVGIAAIISPVDSAYIIIPNALVVRIENYGTQAVTNIPVKCKLNGSNYLSEIYVGTLAPGSSYNYTFQGSLVGLVGASASICVFTDLVNDSAKFNDTICQSLVLHTDIVEVQGFSDVKLFPNPTSQGAIMQVVSEVETSFSLEIIDYAGRKITTFSGDIIFGTNNIEINTIEFSPGIYHIRLVTPNGLINRKLVVE